MIEELDTRLLRLRGCTHELSTCELALYVTCTVLEECDRILDSVRECTIKADVDVTVLRIRIRYRRSCTEVLISQFEHVYEVNSLLLGDLAAHSETVPSVLNDCLCILADICVSEDGR